MYRFEAKRFQSPLADGAEKTMSSVKGIDLASVLGLLVGCDVWSNVSCH